MLSGPLEPGSCRALRRGVRRPSEGSEESPAPISSCVRSSPDVLRLLALFLVTGWAATRAARLELDVENRSMRSAHGSEARAEERRELLFGHDATLVLLLAPRRAGEEAPASAIEAWTEGLGQHAGVGQVLALPDEHPDETLLALMLVPDGSGGVASVLASVIAMARATTPATHELFVSGSPAGEAAIAAALDEEQRRIVPLVAGVLLGLLLLVYRSPALAVGAMLPALGGIAWTGALQQALGQAVNPVTALLPPVLLAVGVAGSVHLVDAYLEARARGSEPGRASREAARAVRSPALACAATTVAGFLALWSSPIPAIERFGGLAAAGVLATAGLAFAALPAWLRLCAGSPRLIARAAGHGPWRWASAGLARGLARFAPGLALLTLVGALFLGWAWTRLTVDTDPLRILPRHHPFRMATERIGARLGGTETFDLLLEPPAPPGGFLGLLALQQDVLALAGVAGPGGPPRLDPGGTGLVTALLEPAGSTAREATFAAAEGLARERGWSAVHATGSAVRVARDSGAIARGEINGLLATFLALGPCIWFGLRSRRLTLLGLAANALPCLALHGGLALAGRPLSVASAMIGSVILGLVVDDAIYFLHGFRAASREAHPRLAVARALQHSGRAISVTTLVLALAFLAGLTGELSTTREFGLLASGSILAAWVANLLLLPAFLLARRRAPSTLV